MPISWSGHKGRGRWFSEQFAKDEVVEDDNHRSDVYASIHDVEVDEAKDGED